jgi:hypothetical protein
MARGPSGRVVIEVDPLLKRDLHSALAADGSSLKEWFLDRVRDYFAQRHQPTLPGILNLGGTLPEPTLRAAEEPNTYKTGDI